MTTLYDFSAIKIGGGVQLAHNFLSWVEANAASAYSIVLPPQGELTMYAGSTSARWIMSRRSMVARAYFEYFELQRYLKANDIAAIYTFFGAGLPRPINIKSIVSVAYPIICYPDSPFWRHLTRRNAAVRQGKNWLRVSRLRKADMIVAETEVMKRRLNSHLGFPRDKISVVPPSPSLYVQEREYRQTGGGRGEFRILILSGLDRHKNIWRLNDVIRVIHSLTNEKFRFVLSCDRESYERSQVTKLPSSLIEAHLEFVGNVPVERVDKLYETADVLLNMSDLESFSNNYMEAWKAGVPLICSDRDFARSICANSAIYCEPHDPESTANAIVHLLSDPAVRASLVAVGKEKVKSLPTLAEKWAMISRLIEA